VLNRHANVKTELTKPINVQNRKFYAIQGTRFDISEKPHKLVLTIKL